jgi:hypothetical protein
MDMHSKTWKVVCVCGNTITIGGKADTDCMRCGLVYTITDPKESRLAQERELAQELEVMARRSME